jgi:hypothetical protein
LNNLAWNVTVLHCPEQFSIHPSNKELNNDVT